MLAGLIALSACDRNAPEAKPVQARAELQPQPQAPPKVAQAPAPVPASTYTRSYFAPTPIAKGRLLELLRGAAVTMAVSIRKLVPPAKSRE